MKKNLLLLCCLALTACGSPFTAGEHEHLTMPDDASTEASDPPDSNAVETGHHEGGHHEAGIEAGGDTRPPPVEAGTDSPVMVDAPPPPVDSGHDSGHDSGPPPPVDAGHDVVTVVDTGPPPPPPDAGCTPPTYTSAYCGFSNASVPTQYCSYNTTTGYRSIFATPPECQCAATYNCACFTLYLTGTCGEWPYKFAGCSEGGGVPQMTCD